MYYWRCFDIPTVDPEAQPQTSAPPSGKLHPTNLYANVLADIKGILPKGPYLPCVSMAGRALLAGYHRYVEFRLLLPRFWSCLTQWWICVVGVYKKEHVCRPVHSSVGRTTNFSVDTYRFVFWTKSLVYIICVKRVWISVSQRISQTNSVTLMSCRVPSELGCSWSSLLVLFDSIVIYL